jgi:hypothetical protein
MSFRLTCITAIKPACLSKHFTLVNEKLEKKPGGAMTRGKAERVVVQGAQGLGSLFESLSPAQALVYGINGHDCATVVTADELSKGHGGNVIARDREHFQFANEPGVLMLDYDPVEDDVLSPADFRAALHRACPGLRNAPSIWRPSNSSCIYNRDTGVELRGVRGQRLYVLVENATDIPRAGQVLFNRLWLAGYGHCVVSKSGAVLIRSVIDGSVWQPERFDFCGGAACDPPLEQRLPKPQLFNACAAPWDTVAALPDLTKEERKQLKVLQDAARAEIEPEAVRVRAQWVDERVAESLERNPTADPERMRDVYARAVNGHRLLGDFMLRSEKYGEVTVGEVLDDPDKFHNTRFADPLEPDYGNDDRIAWANLRAAGRPYIYSHAHGGQRFTLHRQLQTLLLAGGELPSLVTRSLDLIRLDGAIFEHGGELAYVADGAVYPVSPDFMRVYLGGIAHFTKSDRLGVDLPINCPKDVALSILAQRGRWRLPKLRGVISAPLLLPNGRLLDIDGYDEETGLLLTMPDHVCRVPAEPSIDDAGRALRTLWTPFQHFPFVGPVDRGVMLATLLTAAARPGLPTAPATLFDSPTAGSGKTKLTNCVSILAGLPQHEGMPAAMQEDELRKRLLAVAGECRPVMVIDNLVGHLDSAALCAFLTSEYYSDRVLGQSQNLRFPNVSLLLLNGNNVRLVGDLNRRVLRCRIDPQMERPDKRSFDFDPVAYVRANRLVMVEAAITLMRASLQHGGAAVEGRTASFEDWSDLVRQAVVWASGLGVLELADPVDSIDTGFALDPETQKLAALLDAWHSVFGDQRAFASDAIRRGRKPAWWDSDIGALADTGDKREAEERLYDAMYEIAGERGEINSRRLGRWIEGKAGRIVGGRWFERDGERSGVAYWKVRGEGS